MTRQPVLDRFMKYVDKHGPVPSHRPALGRCWMWTGAISDGRGDFHLDGATKNAHIVAYQLLVGPIPAGMELDHLCVNPPCVNPSHLEPVPPTVNRERFVPFGPRGAAAANASKEECPGGHPYDEANTYVWKGRRRCRKCLAERARDRRSL